jgi:hypothetical protein
MQEATYLWKNRPSASLISWFRSLGVEFARIGLEAGPLSQLLYAGMPQAGLPVELLKTRHVHTAFMIMPVKTDSNLTKSHSCRLRRPRPDGATGCHHNFSLDVGIT